MSNKSEATWHPNSGPVTSHADLIKRLRGVRSQWGSFPILDEAADALAGLAHSVPREQYDLTVLELTRQISNTRDERDEARAERDALAHVIEEARRVSTPVVQGSWRDRAAEVDAILYASTAESDLARHDAEVKAQALDEAALAYPDTAGELWMSARAAAIRAEANG